MSGSTHAGQISDKIKTVYDGGVSQPEELSCTVVWCYCTKTNQELYFMSSSSPSYHLSKLRQKAVETLPPLSTGDTSINNKIQSSLQQL